MLYAKETKSVTLSPEELQSFRSYKTDCDVAKLDLDSKTRALDKCLTDNQCQAKWTESKTIVGAGLLTTFLVGLLVGSIVAK